MIKFTPAERWILDQLERRPGALVTYELLIDRLTTMDAVRVHVSRLRAKLGKGSIVVDRPLGYRLRVAEVSENSASTVQSKIDWRDVMKRYMKAVLWAEGVSFLHQDDFSESEWAAIQALLKE